MIMYLGSRANVSDTSSIRQLFVWLACAALAVSSAALAAADTVLEIEPAAPTSLDSVRLKASGELDMAAPQLVHWTLDRDTIRIFATTLDHGVRQPFVLPVELGRLPPGRYSAELFLVPVDHADPLPLQRGSTAFRVTAAPSALDPTAAAAAFALLTAVGWWSRSRRRPEGQPIG